MKATITLTVAVPVAQLLGTTVSLQCNSSNATAFWIFLDANGILARINSTNPSPYTINGQILNIFNISLNNSGLFACGYWPTATSFNAFFTYQLIVEGKKRVIILIKILSIYNF